MGPVQIVRHIYAAGTVRGNKDRSARLDHPILSKWPTPAELAYESIDL